MTHPGGDLLTTAPATADPHPVLVYAADRHASPDDMRVEVTDTTIMLWIGGAMIGVNRLGDDTQLRAALNTAWSISTNAQRFAALLNEELHRRDETRCDAPAQAAMQAAGHHRPPPAQPPDHEPMIHCNGCGHALRPVTAEDHARAQAGVCAPDNRGDCPACSQMQPADQPAAGAA
ncbi:hypothetical protein [Spongiactinospora sp. TRM90649]|uniref:hypothetical protein n=1 Tax=Spongiactinospora sp. TRM90649 TaxID=3031114 RepID=UPI0023F630EB|nr:hypothetical protein [Spongiactinospora sp. TRM90649]MDF5758570.1 hypothetical protein [Spongiactinospora sp. TRM90649]